MFLAGKWSIEIDYESRIFQSWGLVGDPAESTSADMSSRTLLRSINTASGVVWENPLMNSTPAILHFNADGKSSGMYRKISRTIRHPKTDCSKLHSIYAEMHT